MSKSLEEPLLSLVLALRQKLITAAKLEDRKALDDLLVTFTILEECAYNIKPTEIAGIFALLKDSTRDALMGMRWQSDLLSEKEIESLDLSRVVGK